MISLLSFKYILYYRGCVRLKNDIHCLSTDNTTGMPYLKNESAKYYSHHQVATLLQRHKQCIVYWHGKYTHISLIKQLIDVQYH